MTRLAPVTCIVLRAHSQHMCSLQHGGTHSAISLPPDSDPSRIHVTDLDFSRARRIWNIPKSMTSLPKVIRRALFCN